MFAKSHVTMHDWAAGAAKPDNWPSQLTKDWLSATRMHWGRLCFITGNGAHVCWIEEKYMVIHIYGITLNAAKSADQYYSLYSYQSLSLISYLMYNDLHHDCKPYEQTREFFTVSLYSPWLQVFPYSYSPTSTRLGLCCSLYTLG